MSGRIAKRIREAERRLTVGAIEVVLTDGRRLHIRDPLMLLAASFHRRDAMNSGGTFPASEYGGALDMLTECAPAEGCPERLVYTVAGILQAPATRKLTPEEEAELVAIPGESPHAAIIGRPQN